jgi:protoporphyrinogen oxidase
MVPDDSTTSLGLEYFCDEGDALWTMADSALKTMAIREAAHLGLLSVNEVIDSCVLRQPKAYPVYDENYQRNLTILRDYLRHFTNLQTVGRNGMHRYNNMDHAMLTGIMAAENVLGGRHDLWAIDDPDGYFEEIPAASQ